MEEGATSTSLLAGPVKAILTPRGCFRYSPGSDENADERFDLLLEATAKRNKDRDEGALGASVMCRYDLICHRVSIL